MSENKKPENQQEVLNYVEAIKNDTAQKREVELAMTQCQQASAGSIKTDENKTLNKKELAKKVGQGSLNVLEKVYSLIVVNGKTLRGKAYADVKLKEDCNRLALILTGTNLINVFTSGSLFFITLRSTLLFPVAPLTVNLILLWLLNASGDKAAVSHPRESRQHALNMFIALNAILSLIGGIGTELALNRPKLAQILAYQKIVEPYQMEIEELKNSSEVKELEKLRQDIKIKEDFLYKERVRLTGDPNALLPAILDTQYRELNGSYEDSKSENPSYVNKPLEQWPLVPREKKMTELYESKVKQAEEDYINIKQEAPQDKAVSYLRKNEPDIYETYFDEDGLINAAQAEATVAMKSWFDSFITFKWHELSLSLVMFALSVSTSLIATCLIIAHSNREDVKMSHSQEVAHARDTWFDEKIALLIEAETDAKYNLHNNNGNGHKTHDHSLKDFELENLEEKLSDI
ncbi:MAG: hypothetical protein DSM107014_02670 [Gomphosphaeria aponina SAG 52.96 = DSM 107014]|uniref:Uncharacterized protein n=1 Tax=Gomphosphaeria aponina SAG 52.96 = DSM 107014 TaxID=1521640 RepID=A0A941JL76_9CHRO|nr:hypothetical protein [Gomphosphaeria aponina SAG 52.96 = DSM 107014]